MGHFQEGQALGGALGIDLHVALKAGQRGTAARAAVGAVVAGIGFPEGALGVGEQVPGGAHAPEVVAIGLLGGGARVGGNDQSVAGLAVAVFAPDGVADLAEFFNRAIHSSRRWTGVGLMSSDEWNHG
jgi:hypothetical protein